MSDARTTVSVLTPAGTGAIGLVRVTGTDARRIVDSLISGQLPEHGQLAYATLTTDTASLDDVILSCSPAHSNPHIDITLHGGIRVMERVVEAIVDRGALLCPVAPEAAGLFCAADAIDRELLRALARARTKRGIQYVAGMRNRLPAMLGLPPHARTAAGTLRTLVAEMIDRADAARHLLSDSFVVLTGRPNAGKSTLFNRLCGRDSAIVSPIAGTTRDWVEESVERNGLPLTFVDTAGAHESGDALEQRAIAAIRSRLDSADIVLWVHDTSRPWSEGRSEWDAFKSSFCDSKACPRCLVVLSKTDNSQAVADPEIGVDGFDGVVAVSAATGDGIPLLDDLLLEHLLGKSWCDTLPASVSPAMTEALAALPTRGS